MNESEFRRIELPPATPEELARIRRRANITRESAARFMREISQHNSDYDEHVLNDHIHPDDLENPVVIDPSLLDDTHDPFNT